LNFRAVPEQFSSSFSAFSGQFQGSFRAVGFQLNFGDIPGQFHSISVPEQFQSSFRAVSEQFQSSFQSASNDNSSFAVKLQ